MKAGGKRIDIYLAVLLCHLTVGLLDGKLRKMENMSNKNGERKANYKDMNSRKLKKLTYLFPWSFSLSLRFLPLNSMYSL